MAKKSIQGLREGIKEMAKRTTSEECKKLKVLLKESNPIIFSSFLLVLFDFQTDLLSLSFNTVQMVLCMQKIDWILKQSSKENVTIPPTSQFVSRQLWHLLVKRICHPSTDKLSAPPTHIFISAPRGRSNITPMEESSKLSVQTLEAYCQPSLTVRA